LFPDWKEWQRGMIDQTSLRTPPRRADAGPCNRRHG